MLTHCPTLGLSRARDEPVSKDPLGSDGVHDIGLRVGILLDPGGGGLKRSPC